MEGAPSPTRRRRVAAVPSGRHILAPDDAAPDASQHGASTALRAPPSFEGVHADRPADPAGQGHLHAPARLSDDGPAGRKAMVACSVAGGCSARPELWRAAVCSPQRAREAGSGGWPTHARLAPQACAGMRAAPCGQLLSPTLPARCGEPCWNASRTLVEAPHKGARSCRRARPAFRCMCRRMHHLASRLAGSPLRV